MARTDTESDENGKDGARKANTGERPAGAEYRDGEECLGDPEIHRKWIDAYRNPANEKFFSLAFDFIAGEFDGSAASDVLDAGCGTCSHSIRLARRGLTVKGVDISKEVVKTAQKALKEKGLADRIGVGCANLRSLPFRDGQFPGVLCWGVLMHVPEVRNALAELARVLAPGGIMVIGENNMRSVQAVALSGLRRLSGKGKGRTRRTAEGSENWYPTRTGALVTRETDMGWLVRECEANGLFLKTRVAGQMSDLYAWTSSPVLKKAVHLLNILWFKYVRIPQPSYGNIVVLQKARNGQESVPGLLRSSSAKEDRRSMRPPFTASSRYRSLSCRRKERR